MASPVQQTFRKHLGRLRRALARSARYPGQANPLHRVRVELKKWRAGLRLLRSADPAFPYPEMYAPFKNLFAAAGQLRFWQLQRQMIKGDALASPVFSTPYRAYTSRRLRKARKDFLKTAKDDLPSWRELKQEIRQSAETLTAGAVQNYFTTLQSEIAAIVRHPTRRRTAELHDLRKLLKEYAYNRLLTVKYLHFDPGPPAGVPAGFEALLGQWHDQDAACAQLAEDLRQESWEPEGLRAGKKVLRAWERKEMAMWQVVVGGLVGQ